MKKNKNKYFSKIYNENNGQYYLGLDIGTNSIGWAIHNENNDLLDFGVYLDNNISDSKERRSSRSAKRNLRRRNYRLDMFESLAIDFNLIDKELKSKTQFKMYDEHFANKRSELEYSQGTFFPTLYHLKAKGISEKLSKEDIFLCLRHSLKNRGHFLSYLPYEDLEGKLKDNDIVEAWLSKYGITNYDEFFNTAISISNKFTTKKDRTTALENEYKACDKEIDYNKAKAKELSDELSFILGYSPKLKHIENMPINDKGEVISFKISAIDEQVDLPDAVYKLEEIASIFEVKKILGSYNVLSEFMVSKFHKYNKYLYDPRTIYGNINEHYEENIKGFATSDETKDFVKKCLKNGKKIPYLRNFENRILPNQLYYHEAMKLLNKQRGFYEDIITDEFIDKYSKLLKSRIPYYVGPLSQSNVYSENSWIDRSLHTNEHKVTPYNIDEINKTEINKEFIRRMVKTDPYYKGENVEVLHKRSYTYEYFNVLSDLSNFVISYEGENGRHLTKSEKDILLEKFYKTKDAKTINKTKLVKAIEALLGLGDFRLYNDNVDEDTKYSSLKTYIELNLEFKLGLNENDLDEFSKILTLFEDRVLKKEEVNNFLNDRNINLDEKTIKKIVLLNYQGYGKFSKRLLSEEEFEFEGNKGSILNLLLTEDVRFNQIMASNNKEIENQKLYYKDKLEKKNKLDYSLVEDMYGSNIVKAELNNLFIVLNELHKIYGTPKEITIEMAREKTGGGQVKSRKKQLEDQLKELKNNNKKDNTEFIKNMEEYLEENDFISDKIMLYFQQLGKDLYSFKDGKYEMLDLDKIHNSNSKYDIDHIIPYSFNFDNSLNNKVLVDQKYNSMKSNKVPLEIEGLNSDAYKEYIAFLRKSDLISAKKRDNLLMPSLSKFENQGFKNSQLNDTRYITKEIKSILEAYYLVNDLSVQINTISANVVKPIDRKCKIVKIREISDKHHAIDAYMASVVYKAIKEKAPWIDSKKAKYFKEKATEDEKKKFIKSKKDMVKMDKFVEEIYMSIDGSNLIEKIDNKQYRRVYKVRKKVTGEFWHANYGKKKEQDKIANLLVYRTDKEKQKNHAITSMNSARVDVFKKDNKNYIFGVSKSYFNKSGKRVTLNKEAYKYGLEVMNREIWNKKQIEGKNVTLEDFKFSLWYNDLFELNGERYFRTGIALKSQTLEGSILNERALKLAEIEGLIYRNSFINDNKYNDIVTLLYAMYIQNNKKDVFFSKNSSIGAEKTISLLNMLYWYDYILNDNSTIKYDKFDEVYDTTQKQEIAKKYFELIINNESLTTKPNKVIVDEFKGVFESELNEVDFQRLSNLNHFQLISEYNKTIKNNKQGRFRKGISKEEITKIVQSPLGHKQKKITNEKFSWEFTIK